MSRNIVAGREASHRFVLSAITPHGPAAASRLTAELVSVVGQEPRVLRDARLPRTKR